MSISEKQIRANRENAKKSTGPKTENGKAASRQNAVKHGLYSDNIIIDSPRLKEDKNEYERLLASLFEELRPEGVFQEYLVRKIANCLWRSRRVVAAETARINDQLDKIDDDIRRKIDMRKISDRLYGVDYTGTPEEEARMLANLKGVKSLPDDAFGTKILHYEMRLDRQMTRAYKLLQYLQLQQKAKSLQDRRCDIKK